jgi:serine protease Do
MKQKQFTITGVIVILSMLLASCSSVAAILPNQAANNLGLPAQNAAVQPAATPGSASVPAAAPSALISSYEQTLENTYTQVNPSVVNIRVVQKQTTSSSGSQPFPFPFNFPGIPGSPGNPGQNTPQYSQALGSGFVWDSQGHIVTNNHVIDGADTIEVTFADGSSLPAQVVGADAYSDLAVIKVDAKADQLHPVTLADSHQVKVGQLAIAIGNPFGLQGTMTVGIISALGRSLPASQGNQTGAVYSIPDIIQTDAPINPGNSGGVLVNDTGEVVGVTAAIESTVNANAGIGFVIPSAIVQKVIPALIKSGHFDHPYLGISGLELSPDLASAMKLKSDQRGALVEEVVPNGPADKAGLHGSDKPVTINGQSINVGGDVIVAIDGQPINSMDDLIAYLSDSTEVGQKVTLTVLRNGKETSIDITLGTRPTENQTSTVQANNSTGSAWLGIAGVSMVPDIATAMNLPSDQAGVLVQQIYANSPADTAGLHGSFKPVTIQGQQVEVGGDVITAVDGQSVASFTDLTNLLTNYKPGDKITLSILRDGESMQVEITLAEHPTSLP